MEPASTQRVHSECAGSTSSLTRDRAKSNNEVTEASGGNAAQLNQSLSFLGLCGIAVSTGESWIVLGNSLTLAIYNGGAPGVLYGFIVDSICYWVVAAAIAELASSLPSTATVYCWANASSRRYGHVSSWYAGWWNLAAWVVGAASFVSFLTLQILGIWETIHPGFAAANWNIFCCYMACNCFILALLLFGGKWLPRIQALGTFFTLAGWFISIVVCAVMPLVQGRQYESSAAVWTQWQNRTGWPSQGFVFCLGMLNAAFAVCAPDISSHMAEEIPNPKRNVPLAILAQYIASFITGFLYLVTLFYSVSDLEAALAVRSVFPLSQIYLHATNRSATVGLLILAMIPTIIGATGAFGIASRQLWGLARENVTPYPALLSRLSPRDQSPLNATIIVGSLTTLIGCLYLGSTQAFDAIAGSFVLFTSLSYLAALIPHLLSGSSRFEPGAFWMPGVLGVLVRSAACLYLITFSVIFCFPPYLPVTPSNMNYTSVIILGWTLLISLYWFCGKGRGETGSVEPLGRGA